MADSKHDPKQEILVEPVKQPSLKTQLEEQIRKNPELEAQYRPILEELKKFLPSC